MESIAKDKASEGPLLGVGSVTALGREVKRNRVITIGNNTIRGEGAEHLPFHTKV